MTLNLEAKTHNEELVLEYLKENVSEALADKINNGKKTLSQCWNYIVSEARKVAVNNCACVENETVFGWAIHFFEEDDIKGVDVAVPAKAKVENKPTKVPVKKKPKTEDNSVNQISLFEL